MKLATNLVGSRRGLSLLEVLVALAIFLFALIVIGQLVTLAGDRALEVQQTGEATRLCQSKLAEVIAGVVPLSSQGETPFDEPEDPAWQWSLDAEQGDITGLWNVVVKVSRARPDGSRVESQLSQIVLDPTLRGSTFDAVAPSGSDTSTTDPTASGSSQAGAQQTTTPSGSGANSAGAGSSMPSSGTSKPSSGGTSMPSSGTSRPSSGGTSMPSSGTSRPSSGGTSTPSTGPATKTPSTGTTTPPTKGGTGTTTRGGG